ncbi:acid-sensing ion channel 4-B-like isoform X1 [Haliotis asinina]|uniref:acid-sensing ion channel 4-B-like isoform X1 n=1 Tax=Haliotis asinina TaxID=109174 RepID=UPI0035323C91
MGEVKPDRVKAWTQGDKEKRNFTILQQIHSTRTLSGDGMTRTEKTDAEVVAPNYKLRDLWAEFCQTTAIHGFNKITRRNRRFTFRGVLWSVAVCGATAFLIFNLMSEIGDYYSFPIGTKVTNKIRSTIEFPAVTICNRCTLNRSRLMSYPDLEAYFRDASINERSSTVYNFADIVDGIMQQSQSLEWWTNMSMDASSLFNLCYFGGESIDCTSNFRPVFTDEGLCHTFNFNTSDIVNVKTSGNRANLIVNYDIGQRFYTFRENMAAGIKVLLHNSRHHPDANPTVVMAAPGFSTYVAMHKSEYVYLPHPYMAFDEMECVDTNRPDFVNPLKYYSPYTYDHCFMECIQTKAYNLCGCVGPSDPRSAEPDIPICSLEKQDTCYSISVREMFKNTTLEAECQCGTQCNFETFNAQVSSSAYPAEIWAETLNNNTNSETSEFFRNNFLELRVFYDKMMVTSIKQHPQYTRATLFSNVGGQMGLCLGASILTVAEIGELLTFMFLYMMDRLRGRKAENRFNRW